MKKWQIWMALRFSGIKIAKDDLKSILRSDREASEVINPIVLLNKSGMKIKTSLLISYWKKGGNPLNVATGLVFAKSQGYPLQLSEAFHLDKEGKNISSFLAERVSLNP
jgi:uncharacterized protein YqfA (UPF0365 family)